MGIKKWIGGVLIAALVAVLLTALTIVLKTDLMDEYTEPEPVQIADDRLGPLVMQKSNLFKQRERVQQEYIERIQGMGTVTLLFTQPDEIFMDIVVPMMEEKGIVGMVAFGPDQYPGMAGCISMEQWHRLEQAGWEICLLWDASASLSEWVSGMNKTLAAIGIAPSLSVYVPEELFERSLMAEARQMNLKAAVYQGEDGQREIKINDVWLPQAIPWHLDNAGEQVDEIVSDGGSVVLEVYNEIVWDGGYRRLFLSMLDKLVGWQEENKIRITTINQSISYRQGVLLSGTELEAEMRDHLEALNLQIEEIDAQITAIHQEGAATD